ncbi:hypothetical protein AVEN_22050-1 [Araneus ventricosus]|uniref:Uncharacterized protein n=1 Tax=Araneus ventricosus TaxID=182803 RepID=A0A4Y2VTQ5_ARAVE|nr:hypothetical protein AVEN_22050-1 [Araneus ventricosus]
MVVRGSCKGSNSLYGRVQFIRAGYPNGQGHGSERGLKTCVVMPKTGCFCRLGCVSCRVSRINNEEPERFEWGYFYSERRGVRLNKELTGEMPAIPGACSDLILWTADRPLVPDILVVRRPLPEYQENGMRKMFPTMI